MIYLIIWLDLYVVMVLESVPVHMYSNFSFVCQGLSIVICINFFSEKELLKAIEREIYSCNKIIWLAQSDLTEKQQECNQLNVAISLLVSECHQLEFELLKAEEGRKRINCEIMMEMHAVRVGKQEKTLPLQKELECLCSHMEDLKMQSMCLS